MTRRMIDSAMWSNENFAALPAMARLLQVGVINMADDQGRVKAFPAYLRSQIFPYDDVAIADIAKWLKLIAQNGTIEIYQAEGKEYIQLLNWWEYQSLQYPAPSEYPAPHGWRDRIRYNAKGGAVLTHNYVTMKGERLPDTCDSRGNPLGYSVGYPVEASSETPPETPVDEQPSNPPGISTWDTHLDSPPETPAAPPNTIQDQLENKTDQPKQGDEDEDAQACDPVEAAWLEIYGTDMPENLLQSMNKLIAECGEDAVIHGIQQSAGSKSRSFKYIAQCARNYIPPAPPPENSNYANNGNGKYSVNLPGVIAMPAAPQAAAPPAPPMAHDDPWQVALGELMPTLVGVAQSYLKGSYAEDSGELTDDGKPIFNIVVEPRVATGIDWLTTQAKHAVCRKFGSVLRHPIDIRFVAAQGEPA